MKKNFEISAIGVEELSTHEMQIENGSWGGWSSFGKGFGIGCLTGNIVGAVICGIIGAAVDL